MRAYGRIDEPWLLDYLGEIADALFAGAQESGKNFGAALAKSMCLANKRGQNCLQTVALDLRNDAIYSRYYDLIASGITKKRAVGILHKIYELDDKTIVNIIAHMESARQMPVK